MGAAKAVAGGVAAAGSDLLTYLIVHWVPGFTNLPPDQTQNLQIIVAAGLVGVTVYFTPNRPGGKPRTRSTDVPDVPNEQPTERD